jgi:hypothetical protein
MEEAASSMPAVTDTAAAMNEVIETSHENDRKSRTLARTEVQGDKETRAFKARRAGRSGEESFGRTFQSAGGDPRVGHGGHGNVVVRGRNHPQADGSTADRGGAAATGTDTAFASVFHRTVIRGCIGAGLRVLRRVRIGARMVCLVSMMAMLVSLLLVLIVLIMTVLHADAAGTMTCRAAKDHAGGGKPFGGQRDHQQYGQCNA